MPRGIKLCPPGSRRFQVYKKGGGYASTKKCIVWRPGSIKTLIKSIKGPASNRQFHQSTKGSGLKYRAGKHHSFRVVNAIRHKRPRKHTRFAPLPPGTTGTRLAQRRGLAGRLRRS
jgi:hypothetical protein